MGTALEDIGCKLKTKLWSAEILIKQPELIQAVHEKFFEAGAQIATTCSYQASFEGFLEEGYSNKEAESCLRKSIQLALNAKNNCKRGGLKVAFSMGCYGAYLANGSEFTGMYPDYVTEETIIDFHLKKFNAVKSLDFDILLFETVPCLLEARAINILLKEIDIKKPIWMSFSCKNEKLISDGSSLVEECVPIVMESGKVKAIGFNCTDLAFAECLVVTLKSKLKESIKIICYPNKGEVYDPKTKSWIAGDDKNLKFSTVVKNCASLGADIIGGCCRVTPNEIKELSN